MAAGGFQCCTLHPALHSAVRFPIFRPRLLPLIARLAILDALRRPRERDSCGEIELNLEMNIESNELYQPASQLPPPLSPCTTLSTFANLVGVPRPSRLALALPPFSIRLLARLTRFA